MSKKRIAVAVVVLSCLAGSGRAAVPDPDVGWWRFDESTGDTVADSSGKGNTGTIQGAAWVEGGWNGLGWCLDFDGNDDRVELGAIDVAGPGITLAAWINADSFNINDGRIISKANEWGENDHWWMLSTINQSFLRFRLKTAGQATTTLIASQGEIILGEWQHAAATWDGTTMRLYHNAVAVASVAKAGTAVATNPSIKAAIASQPKGAYATDPLHANKFFDGRIDEVRLYSYALSLAQMQELIQGLHPTAWNPLPTDGTVGVQQPLLRWSPSDTGVLHDVYLGTSAELGPQDLVASRLTLAMHWHAPGFEPGTKYFWRVDEIDAAGNVTTGLVWTFESASVTAYGPQPPDGAKWVDPQVGDLKWSLGMNAVTHDVYFGVNEQDVAAGTGDTFKVNQVANIFSLGVLEPGVTYHWRIDEVLLDNSKKPGPVWRFTTAAPGGGLKGEYYANPDLSGTPALVRTDPTVNFAWGTAGPGQPLPASGYSVRWSGDLEVAFTETHTLMVHADDGVRLWFNGELVVDKWFGQEAGSPQYRVKADLEAGQKYPIVVEYFFNTGSAVVELKWESPHTLEQVIPAGALSPPVRAGNPIPANGAVDVTQTPILQWSAGDAAVLHEVYFGADAETVASATTDAERQPLDETTFDPGELEWNKTYYWRVDEVNDAHADSPWKGSVWSFTTADFIVVDDFESYNDEENQNTRIYENWLDGWATKDNGSTVGNWDPPFAEQTIVHSGKQSMPMDYNNTVAPFYSEAYREFSPVQDWTVNGVSDLVVWFRGNPISYMEDAGVITMSGSGHDIWDAADDFRFAYKRLSGNGSITAKVESIGNTNGWAKAGVMIRESLDPGAKFAYVVVTPAQGVSFGWRPFANDTNCGSATQAGIQAPQWVKLTRAGDAFTAQYSADGKAWTDVKDATGTVVSTTLTMTSYVYVGLAVTSHNTAATTTAVFSGISTTSSVTGQWQPLAIGDDPQLANSPQNLYVIVEDSAGKRATAVNPDPAAVNVTAWTEWKIPLSDFAGVNLARVERLYLGVGDKNAPQPDGTGRIYIDDIRVAKP